MHISESVLNDQSSWSKAKAPSHQVQPLSSLTCPSMQRSSPMNMEGGSALSNTGRKLRRTYTMLGKLIVLAWLSCISDGKIKTSMQMKLGLLYQHHNTLMPGPHEGWSKEPIQFTVALRFQGQTRYYRGWVQVSLCAMCLWIGKPIGATYALVVLPWLGWGIFNKMDITQD